MNYSDFVQPVLWDGLFAAIAAVGFALISNPPKRAVFACAFLAAVGHAMRYCLISYAGIDIVVATGVAAFSIGLMSIFFAKRIHCPAEVFCFPSLLPMIPGMFAYRSILALMNIAREGDHQHVYITSFFENSIKTVCIMLALVVGLTLSICREKSFMLTRVKKDSRTPVVPSKN